MQLTGQAVKHRTFGNGIVTGLADNIITICFSQGDKKFLYPDSFARFLTLKDQTTQNKVNSILNKKRQTEDEQKRAIFEEQERIQRMRNLKITANSQAAFDIKADSRDDVFMSWKVFTGRYLSGYSKGAPRKPDKLKPNSVCLLTECKKGTEEKNRTIIGAFMVKEDFFGSFCKDGLVESHMRYRVELPEDVNLKFWDYFDKPDQQRRWGNTAFKYFSNVIMQRILFDINKSLCQTEAQKVSDEFYQYFCDINRMQDYKIDDSSIRASEKNANK